MGGDSADTKRDPSSSRSSSSRLLGLWLLVPDGPKVPVVSFLVEGVHPHDVGSGAIYRELRYGPVCTAPSR